MRVPLKPSLRDAFSGVWGFFPVLYLMLPTQVVCVFRKSLISAVSNLSIFIKDLFQTGKIPFTFLFSFISLVSGLWLMYSGSSHCLAFLSTLHSGKQLGSTWLPLKTPLGENEVLLATSGINRCHKQASMLRQDSSVPSDQAPGQLTLQIWAGSDTRLCRPSLQGSAGCFSHLSSNRLCDVKAKMHLFCWMSEQLYLKYIFSIYIFSWEAIHAIITQIGLYWRPSCFSASETIFKFYSTRI